MESQRAVSFASIRLNFKGIAETSEPYPVALKRNGATVKSWNALTGEQNLSWDGKQNGQALADGNYRIVAMTEKQRDRVRDDQIVVLDNTAPDLIKATLRKSQGQDQLVFQLKDQGAGVDFSQSQVFFSNKDGQALPLQGTGQSLNNQWIYSFNALTQAQKREIKNQQTKVGLKIEDKVANKKTISPVPLSNQCDSGKNIGIQIEGLTVGSAGELTLTGLIEGVDENFSSSDIQLDFDRFLLPLEQTIVLDPVPNQPDKRRFTAIVSSYDPTFLPANAALDEIKVRASIAVADSDCIQLASGTRTVEGNFQTAANITDRCLTGTGKYCLKVETHATCNGSAGSLKLLDCQAKAALINKWPKFIEKVNELYQAPAFFDTLDPITLSVRNPGLTDTLVQTFSPPEILNSELLSFAAIKPEIQMQISNVGAAGAVFLRLPVFAVPMLTGLGILATAPVSTPVLVGGTAAVIIVLSVDQALKLFDDTIDTSVVFKQAADKLRRRIINDTSRPAIERLECQEKDPIKTSQRRPTHHVVAENAGKMKDALQKLKNCGIDVNDSQNGVCLDDSFHKGLHRDDTYYNPINDRIDVLSNQADACENIKSYLRKVIQALRNGKKDFRGFK